MIHSSSNRTTAVALLTFVALLPSCGDSSKDGDDPDEGSGGSVTTGDGDQAASGGATGDGDGDGDGDLLGSGGTNGDGDGDGDAPPDVDLSCRQEGDDLTTLVFVNGCDEELTYAGSDIPGGTIAAGASTCVDVASATEALSAKRYWGYLGEDPGAEKHTLAEFTFNTDFYDFDWYNISHVDAHNLTMEIAPLDRADCEVLTCAESLLDDCPEVGHLENGDGELVSCVSPDRDNPDSPVALHFESCDEGYAWSGDDQNGDDPSPMFACAGEDFVVMFCP